MTVRYMNNNLIYDIASFSNLINIFYFDKY